MIAHIFWLARGQLVLSALAACSLLPAAASAADNGIYIGASVADVSADYDWRSGLIDTAPDEDSGGFKLIGGLRPFDAFAIEVNYVDFGTVEAQLAIACPAIVGFPCPNRASIDASAVSVSALGMLALPLVDFYGRVGVARWDGDRDAVFTSAGSDAGTDPTYGLGLQLRLRSVALRVEYERFELLGDSADTLSVGFTYTFL